MDAGKDLQEVLHGTWQKKSKSADVATLALVIWPIIAIVLFSRLGLIKGLILSVCIGYLFLPEKLVIEIPGFLDYDKVAAISIGALLGMLFSGSSARPAVGNETPVIASRIMQLLVVGCMILIIGGIVMTWLTNREPLVYTQRVVKAVRMHDVISIVGAVLVMLAPYFLARRYLTKPEHHHYVLVALLGLGLIYSLLAVWEIRLSPRIHSTIYGYFQHSWRQHVRSGGFRPLVFLDHALSLGFFLVTALLAALTLARRSNENKRMYYLWAALWFYIVLILAKNFGAIFIATVCGALLLFLNARSLIRVSAVAATIFLFYPAARQANIVPIDTFIAVSNSVNADRVGSFEFRLRQEDAILARAFQKPVAGWGPWARWRVRDERGRDQTTPDGLWIIVLGERGWIGYIGFFGLLVLPTVMLTRTARRREVSMETSGLSVIMMANFIYLVPNSTLSPIGWLIVGSIAGFVQYSYPVAKKTSAKEASDAVSAYGGNRYSRFQPQHRRLS